MGESPAAIGINVNKILYDIRSAATEINASLAGEKQCSAAILYTDKGYVAGVRAVYTTLCLFDSNDEKIAEFRRGLEKFLAPVPRS